MSTDTLVFLICALGFSVCASVSQSKLEEQSARLNWVGQRARILRARISVDRDSEDGDTYSLYADCAWSYQGVECRRYDVLVRESGYRQTIEDYRISLIQGGLTVWLNPQKPRAMTVTRPSVARVVVFFYWLLLWAVAVALCLYGAFRPAVFLENENQFCLLDDKPFGSVSYCVSLFIIFLFCGTSAHQVAESLENLSRFGFTFEGLFELFMWLLLSLFHIMLMMVLYATWQPKFRHGD